MLVSEDSETKNAAVGEEGDEEEEYLACARCNSAIAFYRDVLCEPHPTLNSHVFTYALDIFDDKEKGEGTGARVSEGAPGGVPAYSATNPQNRRFDVIRVQASERVIGRLHLRGPPTSDHSWFPPLAWSFANCKRCGSHIGWAFSKEASRGCGLVAGQAPYPPEFMGIIVTNCRLRVGNIRQIFQDVSVLAATGVSRTTTCMQMLKTCMQLLKALFQASRVPGPGLLQTFGQWLYSLVQGAPPTTAPQTLLATPPPPPAAPTTAPTTAPPAGGGSA